jgi:hypothetical protein
MATNCKNCGVKLACLGWRTCDLCDKKEKDRKLASKIRKLNQLAEKRKKKKKEKREEEVVLTQARKYNLEPENLAGFFQSLNLSIESGDKLKKIVRYREPIFNIKIKVTHTPILVCPDCKERYLKPLGCLLCKKYSAIDMPADLEDLN